MSDDAAKTITARQQIGYAFAVVGLLGVVGAILIGIRWFVPIATYRVASASMEPTLHEDSARAWSDWLKARLAPDELKKFPDLPLAPLTKAMTDPERVRDTTVFLARDGSGGIHAATSTSGWAWKYPGRIGDSPIPGAGFYADSRYGAAACTHTGEMTMRCGTARTIVLAMKLGRPLSDAIKLAVEELAELTEGFLGGVVIHAMDANGNHEVVNFRCEGEIAYWLWDASMSAPEKRIAKTV